MSTVPLERAVQHPPGAPGRRCWLGVAALDELLPVQGVSPDSQIMVIGDTGVGKTVLAAQFLYEGLLVGDRCVYVACDEPPQKMRENMANLRMGTLAYEQAGQLVFVDAYGRERSTERLTIQDPRSLDEFFEGERQAIEGLGAGPVRLVVDSLSTLYGGKSLAEVLEFNRLRLRYLTRRQVLTLDSFVTMLLDEQVMAGLSHSYPILLRLGFLETGTGLQRFLQLGKLRSGMFRGERRFFRIDPRTGIVAQR